jgi:formylglycine-generating enzyme required for sulfatase activity
MFGNVSEWTQSGRDWALDDLFGPVSSAATTRLASTPEFTEVIDRDSYVLTAGSGYWNSIGTNCGHSLFMTRTNIAQIARQQLVGFRLVRTIH